MKLLLITLASILKVFTKIDEYISLIQATLKTEEIESPLLSNIKYEGIFHGMETTNIYKLSISLNEAINIESLTDNFQNVAIDSTLISSLEDKKSKDIKYNLKLRKLFDDTKSRVKNTSKNSSVIILKTINIDRDSNKEQIISKLEISMAFNSPNVITTYGYIITENTILLLLEFGESGDLFEYLDANINSMSSLVKLNILFQIANGIKYIHDCGYVHRDLKPENVALIVIESNIIAKIIDVDDICSINEPTKNLMGTPGFMYPHSRDYMLKENS
jgi:serine/threonine protein kinase